MIRLVDIASQDSTKILFQTPEITSGDVIPYIIYDTSTGSASYNFRDYIAWRSLTATSTGTTDIYYTIDNTNLYPSYEAAVSDYSVFDPSLFVTVSYPEYFIIRQLLTRLDLVRRRLPNPGVTVSGSNGVGNNGVVSFSGGYEKKFAISELMQFIEGTIFEVNWTSPQTTFWPTFMTADTEKINNPYARSQGLPNDMVEIVVQGAILKALVSWGFLEVDLSFSTTDSGLSITFDRVSHVKGWHDTMFQNYEQSKKLFKMNYANHSGIGVGTYPYAAYGIYGTMMNNVQVGGALAMTSLLGWSLRGSTPM
jgi:hypothetical protein